MATRYHISEDGLPGPCRAASQESCPKTRAGDDFHGDLAEATAESERRFEGSYGATVTLSSKVDQKHWDSVAKALHRKGTELHRAQSAGDIRSRMVTNRAVEDLTKEGLAELHGVEPIDVSATADHYIVAENDGTRRAYGWKNNSTALGYLGVLHPKLTQPATLASEHKAFYQGREATPEESQHRSSVWYGYGRVALKGHGTVEYTTDSSGAPVDAQVWDDIDSSAVPRELFEDESLRRALKSRGILRD